MGDTRTYEPDYAVPPGETLAEVMDEIGITRRQIAHWLKRSIGFVDKIIQGDAAITERIAAVLERATAVPAQFWLNREAIYQRRKAKFEAMIAKEK